VPSASLLMRSVSTSTLDGTYDFSRINAHLKYVFDRHINSVLLGDTAQSMADEPEAQKQESRANESCRGGYIGWVANVIQIVTG